MEISAYSPSHHHCQSCPVPIQIGVVTGEHCSNIVTTLATHLLVGLALVLAGACAPTNQHNTGRGDAAVVADADGQPGGPDYSYVFDTTQLVHVVLSFSPANWQALQVDTTTYVPGTIQYGDEVVESVGIRFKGNVSLQFGGDKKSFKVKFTEYTPGARFHGLKIINLHNAFKDPTLLRERLAWTLLRTSGTPASRSSHVEVYVTVAGLYDKEYFGLYNNTEQVDSVFLKDRFPSSAGVLYKGNDGADTRWWGEPIDEYVPIPYEPKTHEQSADHQTLVEFLRVVNETTAAEFAAQIEGVFEVAPFLSWLAANTLLANLDNLAGNSGNFYLYYCPETQKFSHIPWDQSEAFGSTSEGLSINELLTMSIERPVAWPTNPAPLIGRILNVPEYRQQYYQKLRELVDGPFAIAHMNTQIDDLYTLTHDAARRDTRKDYSNEQYEQSFDEDVPGLPNPPFPEGNMVIGLRRFVGERSVSVAAQLDSL